MADKLKQAKMPDPEKGTIPEAADLDNGPLMVTETIASIYEMQGAYEEAIKAYQILVDQEPEKKALYSDKIENLKAKIQS